MCNVLFLQVLGIACFRSRECLTCGIYIYIYIYIFDLYQQIIYCTDDLLIIIQSDPIWAEPYSSLEQRPVPNSSLTTLPLMFTICPVTRIIIIMIVLSLTLTIQYLH